MQSSSIIKLLSNPDNYHQLTDVIAELKNPQNSKLLAAQVINAIEEILGKDSYRVVIKFTALRFLKQCFQTGNNDFVAQTASRILPILRNILEDSKNEAAFSKYAPEDAFKTQQSAIQFKSLLMSMFRLASQCINNWAAWIVNSPRQTASNPFVNTYNELKAKGLKFQKQDKYFRPGDYERFIAGYSKITDNNNRREPGSITLKVPESKINSMQAKPKQKTRPSDETKKALESLVLSLRNLPQKNLEQKEFTVRLNSLERQFENKLDEFLSNQENTEDMFHSYINKFEDAKTQAIKEHKDKQMAAKPHLDTGGRSRIQSEGKGITSDQQQIASNAEDGYEMIIVDTQGNKFKDEAEQRKSKISNQNNNKLQIEQQTRIRQLQETVRRLKTEHHSLSKQARRIRREIDYKSRNDIIKQLMNEKREKMRLDEYYQGLTQEFRLKSSQKKAMVVHDLSTQTHTPANHAPPKISEYIYYSLKEPNGFLSASGQTSKIDSNLIKKAILLKPSGTELPIFKSEGLLVYSYVKSHSCSNRVTFLLRYRLRQPGKIRVSFDNSNPDLQIWSKPIENASAGSSEEYTQHFFVNLKSLAGADHIQPLTCTVESSSRNRPRWEFKIPLLLYTFLQEDRADPDMFHNTLSWEAGHSLVSKTSRINQTIIADSECLKQYFPLASLTRYGKGLSCKVGYMLKLLDRLVLVQIRVVNNQKIAFCVLELEIRLGGVMFNGHRVASEVLANLQYLFCHGHDSQYSK